MKPASTIIFILLYVTMTAQFSDDKNWLLFENEPIIYKTITKTEEFKTQDLTFKVQWDNELSYSENLERYYGGISTFKIYYKGTLLQTLNSIEDGVGLGEIHVTFYDFNMDGFLDFSIQRDCGKSCYDSFYIYNRSTKKFIHQTDWDFLRIQKINKISKQILSKPDGNTLEGEKELYKVNNREMSKTPTMLKKTALN